jgi:glycosyltransferase involved in cell wall biosynthesis
VSADSRDTLGALYLCYLSLDDPLVETQVVAYLEGLARDREIHLLTFELRRPSRRERRERRRSLAVRGINWHSLRYHRRPSLPATAFDTLAGAMVAGWLVRRHGLGVLHARSHVPAVMALLARRFLRQAPKLLFDVRGLMAEEYEDAGRWRRESVAFRLIKAVERIALAQAAGVVVLTDAVRAQIASPTVTAPVVVIPCCVDPARVATVPGRREEVRAHLGLGNATVLVYVGKLGTWYMPTEMALFAAAARSVLGEAQLVVLSQDDLKPLRVAVAAAGLPASAWWAGTAHPEELGDYLAAADAGLSFVRPTPSKISSSPTKVAEYLAAGLPVVFGSGVGDLDEQLAGGVSVRLERFDNEALIAGCRDLGDLLDDPNTASRCRKRAGEHFDLEVVGIARYRALYDHLDRELAPHAASPAT